MYKIKTLNKISPAGLSQFDSARFSVSDAVEAPDGILVRSADMHSFEFNENLRAIARAGAGTNNIPIERCSEEGIVVFNTPGANANAVKELLICALLLSSRDIIGGISWVNSLAGNEDMENLVEKGKSAYIGPEIQGKSLGVIGLGAVGVQVANIATKLGMNVYGYDPYLSVEHALQLSRMVVRETDLSAIYARCDYITIHSPLTPDTRGMLNASSFSAMKHGVRIINLARGGLVDDEDIISALETGRVARYVTDFPDPLIVGKKGVICIPHLGASTPESEENCAVMAARELRDYLEYGTIRNSVNMPDAEMARTGVARVGLFHRNVPNMLSSILATLTNDGMNIENMLNRSKGSYAYTLIDFGSQLPQHAVSAMKELEGVLRVRVIK